MRSDQAWDKKGWKTQGLGGGEEGRGREEEGGRQRAEWEEGGGGGGESQRAGFFAVKFVLYTKRIF
jgi:hypothetical protein